jgi:hypothetical protein
MFFITPKRLQWQFQNAFNNALQHGNVDVQTKKTKQFGKVPIFQVLTVLARFAFVHRLYG